jgi:hypothetical protein
VMAMELVEVNTASDGGGGDCDGDDGVEVG